MKNSIPALSGSQEKALENLLENRYDRRDYTRFIFLGKYKEWDLYTPVLVSALNIGVPPVFGINEAGIVEFRNFQILGVLTYMLRYAGLEEKNLINQYVIRRLIGYYDFALK